MRETLIRGSRTLGARYEDGRTSFKVWAPLQEMVKVCMETEAGVREIWLEPGGDGYHRGDTTSASPGTRYTYHLDGEERPDPASRWQPEGIHGPSAVVDPHFDWSDHDWRGIDLSEYVIYELHVGTFSQEGTFDGVISYLDYLDELGVTAIELMPVAQFPGARNWGYDGVGLYAAQNTYGGPDGLRRLVDECHRRGLAVVLDVVYNHLGPEGNYLRDFGPYFTDRYHTPWGDAVNYDGPGSDNVRRFFIENALYWTIDCHVDALRLDAVHAIIDYFAYTFLEELGEAVHGAGERLGRAIHLMPETDLNDPRFVRPRRQGGYGLDAQWNDDFHHALHSALTGERDGYYSDFGRLEQMATAMRRGYVLAGEYSGYRQRRHGSSPDGLDGEKFIVCAQNHDQVGNRMLGERLSALISFESQKLAAGVTLLSPFIPLLFMGEEYGETAPFQYFVDHEETDLRDAVRSGRRAEFASFAWNEEPPDPAAPETFERSRLNHSLRERGPHRALVNLYRELLRLRRETPALANLKLSCLEAEALGELLTLRRWVDGGQALAIFNFAEGEAVADMAAGRWRKVLDSADGEWEGAGATAADEAAGGDTVRLPARSFALYTSVA
ncbi:MAG TPA: malto-oligosyltrehalose trehalohydrolase [Dehalococcoidia bacterium]|nr:malto-oligosyltrehalose trehalohydrolase [Dehalococcoidia bacterium]